jgi:hypothetical protein
MNKISGPGQFRPDSTHSLAQSVMIVDAVSRATGDDVSSRAIGISIREKLPLMNGLGGCEAEIQLTPEQAARFAQALLELVSRIATHHGRRYRRIGRGH